MESTGRAGVRFGVSVREGALHSCRLMLSLTGQQWSSLDSTPTSPALGDTVLQAGKAYRFWS